LEDKFTIVEIFKRMVPRHEHEFFSLVLLALPPCLVATFKENSRGSDEEKLWTAVSRIRAENSFNLDVAIELEILATAFAGVHSKEADSSYLN